MKHYRMLTRTATDAIVTIDADNRIRYANEAVERVLGHAPEELEGDPLTRVIPERLRNHHRAAFERYLATGERHVDWAGIELPGLHADGHEVPIEISFAEFEAGDEHLFTGIIRDVTARKEREHDLREQRDQFEQLVAEVEEYAIFMLDTEGHVVTWNAGAERIKGYTEGEILGEHFSTFYPEAALEAGQPEWILEQAVDHGSVEAEGWRRRKDGSRFWANVTVTAIHDDGDLQGFTKVTRDMTERKRREDRLAGLNELASECLEAETRQQVADLVVDQAASLLDLPVALIAFYDSSSGTFEPVAATPGAESTVDAAELLAAEGPAWGAFSEYDARALSADADGLTSDAGPVGIWPLGRHGVLVASIDESVEDAADAFEAIVAATMQTALDSAEHLQLLAERETRLSNLAEDLDRLNRVNEVIRRVDRALVAASTRAAIETAVCEELARFEPYRFVVVAAYDQLDEAVVAREWAGDDQGYLDAVDLTTGSTANAAETREPQVVQELLSDPPLAPWREAALVREFGSCLALPLVYADSLYGVLTVFGARPGLFDEMELNVLAELADNVAQAINAAESRMALVSDRVVELEFTTRSEDVPFVALATETGGTLAFEGVVPQQEDRFRSFFTMRGAAAADVRGFLQASAAIEDYQMVAEREDSLLVSCLLTDAAVLPHLVNHGAVPRQLTAEPGEGRLVVDLSPASDIRAFVETLGARCRDVELVAKRERERELRTRQGFRATIEDALTDRKLEILQTAFYSGYFESPRDSTGEMIAASLGISQPTFADHLRTAHRTLLDLLFDEQHPPEGGRE